MVRDVPGNAMNLRALQAMVRAPGRERNEGACRGYRQSCPAPACLEAGCEFGQGAVFEERKQAHGMPCRAVLGKSPAALDAFYLSQALNKIDPLAVASDTNPKRPRGR